MWGTSSKTSKAEHRVQPGQSQTRLYTLVDRNQFEAFVLPVCPLLGSYQDLKNRSIYGFHLAQIKTQCLCIGSLKVFQ